MTVVTVLSLDGGMGDLGIYRTWLESQGMSANTVDQRVSFAHARWNDWGRWDVEPDVAARFLSHHHGWTRRTYHSHLGSMYRWLVETERTPLNVVSGIRKPPMPRKRPHPLSPPEMRAALDGADGHLLTWIQLGRLAGLRRFEIAKIRGEDVGRERLFVLGKGGQAEMVPTHADLWDIAQHYPRRGFWFPSETSRSGHVTPQWITKRTADLFASLEIEGSIHRTRANYGTDLLRNGANIRVVQSLMRHRSIASTEHYLADEEQERIAAIASLAA